MITTVKSWCPLKLSFLPLNSLLTFASFTSDMLSSQLQLHRYATGRESRVITALTLLKSHLFRWAPLTVTCTIFLSLCQYLTRLCHYVRYQGHVSATLVLGEVDCTGPHLHTVIAVMTSTLCIMACQLSWAHGSMIGRRSSFRSSPSSKHQLG